MKKIVSLFIAVLVFVTSVSVMYAPKAVDYIADVSVVYEEGECRENEIALFSDSAPTMDFSLLDGQLSVEISGDFSDATALIIGEYNINDQLVRVHRIKEIKSINSMPVYESYQKAFLWNEADMMPLCKRITTKCSYEIVEGMEKDWIASDDGHTLYKYIGNDSDITIPNSYNGKRIYSVQNIPEIETNQYSTLEACFHYNIFNSRRDITSVTVSEGIRLIGSFAFAGCNAITSFPILPDTVIIIGNYSYYGCSGMSGTPNISDIKSLYPYAFYGCSGLTGKLVLPNIQSIPNGAFLNCRGFTGRLNIPEGVESIGKFSFGVDSGNGNFSSVTLPSTLKSIGCAAFQRQTKLSNELILPDGLEYIGDAAFNHCSGFTNIVLRLPNSLKTIGGDLNCNINTGYGSHVFYNSFMKVCSFEANGEFFKSVDGVLYSSDMKRLAAYPPGKTDKEFTVPDTVSQIDEMAFGYSKFEKLILPDTYVISDTVPQNVINKMANNLAVALYHNNSIKSICVNNTNQNYTCIDGIVYSKDLKKLWYVPTNYQGTVNINEAAEIVCKGAFYIEYADRGEIYTGVYVPASVKSIHAESLKSINLRPLENIIIDENNKFYKLTNGKIVSK